MPSRPDLVGAGAHHPLHPVAGGGEPGAVQQAHRAGADDGVATHGISRRRPRQSAGADVRGRRSSSAGQVVLARPCHGQRIRTRRRRAGRHRCVVAQVAPEPARAAAAGRPRGDPSAAESRPTTRGADPAKVPEAGRRPCRRRGAARPPATARGAPSSSRSTSRATPAACLRSASDIRSHSASSPGPSCSRTQRRRRRASGRGDSEPRNRRARWTGPTHGRACRPAQAWSMQTRVEGMTSRRAAPISLPHTSQVP